MCILAWEWSGMKVHIVSVEKIFRNMGGLIRIAGEFGVSGDVDPPKSNLPSMVIAEVTLLDRESQRRHGM
jgi:hypothetical protein